MGDQGSDWPGGIAERNIANGMQCDSRRPRHKPPPHLAHQQKHITRGMASGMGWASSRMPCAKMDMAPALRARQHTTVLICTRARAIAGGACRDGCEIHSAMAGRGSGKQLQDARPQSSYRHSTPVAPRDQNDNCPPQRGTTNNRNATERDADVLPMVGSASKGQGSQELHTIRSNRDSIGICSPSRAM